MNLLVTPPPIASTVTFSHSVRDTSRGARLKTFRGRVVEHVPSEDGWDAGIMVFWPTMTYQKTKGVKVYHAIPNPWIKAEAT